MSTIESQSPSSPKHKRRWYQYSLRTLLVFVLLVSIGLSWVVIPLHRSWQQKRAAEAMSKLDGWVIYDYQEDASGRRVPDAKPPGPSWLRRFVGDDFFAEVVYVRLKTASDDDLEPLRRLPRIRNLELECTQVTDTGLTHLSRLTQLQKLDLSYTNVTDAGLEHLSGLTDLTALGLCHTRVTGPGLEHLRGLTQLKSLGLRNTDVTDAGLEHLKRLTQLRWLYLTDTSVTDAGGHELEKALPNCKIEW